MDEKYLEMAEAITQAATDKAIKDALIAPTTTITPCGSCHNCGDDVSDEQLFCNGKCATEYHRRGG